MRRSAIAAALLAALSVGAANAADTLSYDDHMSNAREAFAREDWTALARHLDEAQKIRPYSLYIWRNRILSRQLSGDTAGALALTAKAAERGLALDLSGHEAFDALTAHPDFRPIADRMKANLTPLGDTLVHAVHDDAGLLPEAYARDGDARQYVGSVRTGRIIDFRDGVVATAPGGVFDIEIRDGRIWAAVNNQLAYESADPENKFAAVMVFDRKTGALTRDLRVAQADVLLGDLEVGDDGAAYASDSVTPRLFRLRSDDERLTVFAADPRFVNLQGIALDEDNHRIFVADYLTGLFVIDTRTATVQPINNTIDAHLGGVDGLYLYNGDLIGIQNGTTPQRIVRIGLNADGTDAVRFEVLARNLPEWNEPTHGAVEGGVFYYIATSNWPAYDDEGRVRPEAELKPVRIMKVPLR